jgi:hypothetical protein
MSIEGEPRILVQSDIQSGTLVAPFGFVPGNRELVLWSAPRLASRPELRHLAAWLAEELAASNATPLPEMMAEAA